MAAINEINKAPVRAERVYKPRVKKEVQPEAAQPTNRQIAEAVPGIDAVGIAQLTAYLDTDLRDLRGGRDIRTDLPWTRESLISHYEEYYARMAEQRRVAALSAEKKAAELAERRKNWNPTDADKLKFMKDYMGLRNKTDGRDAANRTDSFCTCCGMFNVAYPGMEDAKRMRWEIVADGAEMHKKHNAETLRIKDQETGKDMIISWDNK